MKLKHQRSRQFGINKIEILTIITVLGAVVVLAAQALSANRADRKRTHRQICVNNLKQVGEASWVWAGEHGDKFPIELSEHDGGIRGFVSPGAAYKYFQTLSNLTQNRPVAPKIFRCPADASKKPARGNLTDLTDANVSYFFGADAAKMLPSTFLAGDRNLTNDAKLVPDLIMELTPNSAVGWTERIHSQMGNILLADLSVQIWSTGKLREGLANTGIPTNRLVMPSE